MSKKAFSDQYEDEEVLYLFRRHPVVMRRYLIAFSVALLLGALPSLVVTEYIYFFGGLGAGLLLGALIMLYGWMGWYFSVFTVTNQRFIQTIQNGLFDRSVIDIAVDQIQMVNYQVKGVQQTLLGFGTLSVQTQVGELTIANIHHPAKVQKDLNLILRELAQGATA